MFRTLVRRTVLSPENCFTRVIVRTAKTVRKRAVIPDTTKFIPLLDETQLFVPVVHRRHPIPLREINGPRRSREDSEIYQIFDEIKVPKLDLPNVDIILVRDVPGKGVKGTKLSLPGDKAYAEYLVPQFAVYATPENEEKYSDLIEDVKKNTAFSTITAQHTAYLLSQQMIFIFMNMVKPWTIEKWHVRASFRQCGIILTDDCLELPSQPISGPDPQKEGKHFIVTVTINGKERAPVLCRINHFINDETQKLPIPKHFTPPFDPVFEEDRAQVEDLIRHREEILKFKF